MDHATRGMGSRARTAAGLGLGSVLVALVTACAAAPPSDLGRRERDDRGDDAPTRASDRDDGSDRASGAGSRTGGDNGRGAGTATGSGSGSAGGGSGSAGSGSAGSGSAGSGSAGGSGSGAGGGSPPLPPPPAPPPPPSGGGGPSSCGAETTGQACYQCCAQASPNAERAGFQAFGACACQSPGTCASACGSSFCAGQEPQQGDACTTCLEGAQACQQAADQACQADAACSALMACVQASGCEGKP